MKRLLTGALIAAVLVSQTSIADVFVHTDAATVKAAENQEGADDIVVDFTDDSATPGNTDPEEVVQQEDIVGNPVVNPNEEQTPEETPTDSDVIPEEEGTSAEISGAAADVQDGTKIDVPYDAVQDCNNEIMTAGIEAVACDGSCGCSNCDSDCECDADCSCTETGECGDDCNCSCNTSGEFDPNGEYEFTMKDSQGTDVIKATYSAGSLTIEPKNDSTDTPMPDYEDADGVENEGTFTDIPWWEFREHITSIEIMNHITSIGAYVFMGCENVTSVTISNDVKAINEGAFKDCANLTSINFESGNMTLETIGDKAFSGCIGLTSIALPRGVKNIANDAFDGCSNLGVIIYPQGADISNVDLPATTAKIEYKFDDSGKIQITKIESSDKVSLPSEIFGEKIASVADDVNKDLIGEHEHIGNGNDCSAKCDICGEDLHPEMHVYEATKLVEEANCTDAAIWLYTCSTCGTTKEDSNADEGPLGHSYTAWDSNESNHWHVCSRCNEKDPDGSEDPHGSLIETTTGGFKVTKCSVCEREMSKVAIGGNNNNNNNNNNNQSTDSNNGGSSSGSGSSSSGSSSNSTSATTGSVWNTVSTAAEIPGTITTAITYTVQSGDTLSKIAVKYYGSASYWTKIYEDNKDTIKDPNKIYVGQVIIINVVQVDTASAVAGTTATGEGSHYTVESGDSLYKIAKKVYGDGKDWRLIYNANDAITDPGRIYSGQVIFIPVKQ